MGDYTISDKVINAIAAYEAQKIQGVDKIQQINIRKTGHGVHIDITLALRYGCNIYNTCRKIQVAVRDNVEKYTSINARKVHIIVNNLNK